MVKLNFKINCRECGKPMIQVVDYLESAIFCKDCGLKAEVSFSKTKTIKY